ncbi:hypothetical protein R0L47_05610 [Pectobacterium polonicum]|uniref:hypothetical protein n=1 Tax=Pectobacterium polonicum TaxID=2485124 RepID=UPI0037552867
MSSLAAWSYTAKATIWPVIDTDRYGKPTFGEPVVIDCDYGGTSKQKSNTIGNEIVVKLLFWTEYADAKQGDMIAIGEHSSSVPIGDADEIVNIERYADTFERLADDYEIATGA